MTDTDDKLKRMSFKDFTVVDYMPGEGEYINYQAQKRHRGTVGEEVEQVDELSDRLLNRYSDAAKKDKKKDHKKGLRKARNIRTLRQNKGLWGQFTGESVEQIDKAKLAEAMTVPQRIKAKQRMKKMSKRIQMAKKRSMKRAPSMDKLKLRAKKQAKNSMIKKWMRGKSKSEMSFSQRQNIEKRLKSASGRIDTMSKKLLPSVRQMDRERRANANKDSEKK